MYRPKSPFCWEHPCASQSRAKHEVEAAWDASQDLQILVKEEKEL